MKPRLSAVLFCVTPLGTNPTPAWGHVGQVGGCQNNLEVGDPLSGTDIPTVTMPNGFTYHLQELAFFSWFYGAPSIGSGGLFSDNSTFKPMRDKSVSECIPDCNLSRRGNDCGFSDAWIVLYGSTLATVRG